MKNKILITGASSEIGQAISKKLAQNASELILHCNQNKEELESFSKEFSIPVQIHSIDFHNTNSLESFLKEINEVDTFIHAASRTITSPLPFLSQDEIDQMIRVNVQSYIRLCSHIIPQMLSYRRGCVVCITSVTASRGNRGQSVYAGTKGFLESFSRSLAAEYGSKGIRINCVAPGPIQAGSLNSLMEYANEEVKNSIAYKRIGKPEDVASLVNFLCSEEAEFIHGKTIGVDGGFLRGV